MVSISVKTNIKEATRKLNRIQKKQIPFATAKALTRTAQAATRDLKKQIEKDIDRPTPFTLKGPGFKPASKRNLTALVFIKDIQAKYLTYQVHGGTRRPKGKAEAVPFKIRLNKYGNIPGRRSGKIAKLLAKPNVYTATIKGIHGVWERKKTGQLKLLIAFENKVKYQNRLDFYGSVRRTVNRVFKRRLQVELVRALRTAR